MGHKHIFLSIALATLCTPAFAQGTKDGAPPKKRTGEIRIFGQHSIWGSIGQQSYIGNLQIRKDSSYSLSRTFNDGRTVKESGIVLVAVRQLTLRSPKRALRFSRVEDKQRYVWHSQSKTDQHWFSNGQKIEGSLGVVGRMVKRKSLFHWLLKGNIGTVDSRKGAEIFRSKEPTPDRIAQWKKKGVKTIFSLNGDLHGKKGWLHSRDKNSGKRLPPKEVELKDFIQQQKLEHVVVSMSAKKAPTDEQLITVFKVLLDDRKRPLVFHCRGGSDRTGVIAALYQIEFLGMSKVEAKKLMRKHLWAANDGTSIQGLAVDLYRPGHIRKLLKAKGIPIPERYKAKK
jgi:hypothetical protein